MQLMHTIAMVAIQHLRMRLCNFQSKLVYEYKEHKTRQKSPDNRQNMLSHASIEINMRTSQAISHQIGSGGVGRGGVGEGGGEMNIIS